MPAMCHFYGYTPEQFWDMECGDTQRLVDYMREVHAAGQNTIGGRHGR